VPPGTPIERVFTMSKNINVNPGQYKTSGRERQGEDVNHEQEKARATRLQALRSRGRRRRPSAPSAPPKKVTQ
jgi:hypothetical protein